MGRTGLSSQVASLWIIAVAALAVAFQFPPDIVPRSAPAEAFSAERAAEIVERIAANPHPMGSVEAREVREFLAARMRDLGLAPEVLASPSNPSESLLGTLPGTHPGGKAVLLMAHYDSRPGAPGAGDDAAGVAAILETVRALKTGPLLANDLMILFTDGEESGLLGAQVFVEDPARVQRVGVALNFEGRGNRGPSYMFETSENNGRLIREFARAAPHPMGTSLGYAVYRLMNNNTDLTILKNAGIPGLNFAFVDGVEHYHQPSDTLTNLDLRSMQHHGSYALALSKHFGGLDLNTLHEAPDAIYFHVMGPHLIVYDGWLVAPLTVAATLMFAGVLVLGFRRRLVTWSTWGAGISTGVVAMMVSLLVPRGLWLLIAPWRTPVPGKLYRGSPEIAWAFAFLGLVVALFFYARSYRNVGMIPLALGGLFGWVVLTIAATFGLPGGSYLFVWPTIFGLAGLSLTIARPRGSLAFAMLGSLAALVMIPPTIQTICTALGPEHPFAVGPIAGLFVMAIVPILAEIPPKSGEAFETPPNGLG